MKKIFNLLFVAALGISANAQDVVISQIYGAGGNKGSIYKRDYVVLHNNTANPIDMSNWSIQYAPAKAATGQTPNPWSLAVFPTGTTIAAYGNFLVGLGSNGEGGTFNLPAPDYNGILTGTGSIQMSATRGKVVLMKTNVRIPKESTYPTPAGDISDYVGYGEAETSEGASAAPEPSNTTAIFRKITSTSPLVYQDTNVNSADFGPAAAPAPINAAGSTGSTLAVGDIKVFRGNFVKNTIVTNEINFGEKANVKIYNVSGSLVKSASVDKNTSLNVSSLPKGAYVVTGELNGETVSQKIIKK